MYLYFFILFILGTIFGSFSSVLIGRWKSGQGGIMMGRSECPECHHTLSGKELIPLLSFIMQKGKCANCRSKISSFYPFTEIVFGLLFPIMGYISISFGNDPISPQTLIFLVLGFITGVYILYDLRYMEIPDQIMIPGIAGYFLLLILGFFFLDIRPYIFDLGTYLYPTRISSMSDSEGYRLFFLDHIRAAILIYSFFYLQILLPGGVYLLKHRRIKDFMELLISYFTFPVLLIFGKILGYSEPDEDEEEAIPAWIGGGDLRIALFIGLTLGGIHTLSTLFFAYISGSIIGIFILSRKGRKNSHIAFGPFLGIGWLISLIFYFEILNLF